LLLLLLRRLLLLLLQLELLLILRGDRRHRRSGRLEVLLLSGKARELLLERLLLRLHRIASELLLERLLPKARWLRRERARLLLLGASHGIHGTSILLTACTRALAVGAV